MNMNMNMNMNLLAYLPIKQYQATYIWIDGNNTLRSKSKTINKGDKIPMWDFDGSSTNQAPNDKTEIHLLPVAKFKDPFRADGLLVLCETYMPNGEPHITNKRYEANKIFEKKKNLKPWFGIEQEFFILNPNIKKKLSLNTFEPQGKYYCSVGTDKVLNRQIMELFYRAALYAELKISGINAEVAPSQWEFQVGPCLGIEEGDHLWVARYILERIAENYNVIIDYSPKPFTKWNGSGAHVNYSTEKMREEGGLSEILNAVDKLEKNHKEMINIYGNEDNKLRLTGKHETAYWKNFSWGYGNRCSTVRIGNNIKKEGKGYMEIRAVSSNCDPYIVSSKIFDITTN